MAIQIGNYKFDGPFSEPSALRNQTGVYAVLGGDGSSPWTVVDIGESRGVGPRVEQHDRAKCWNRQRHPRLAYAAYYCNEQARMRVEQELREQYKPPCGDR